MKNLEKIIILSGPSGVGKTTVAKKLLQKVKDLEKVITLTSRKPRGKEISGKDYFFIREKEFKKKIKKREFLEWARVHDHFYGTLKKEVEKITKKKKIPLLVIDVQGALQVKKKLPKSKLIFLKSDSKKNLLKRIKKRHQKINQKELIIRLKNAKEELKKAKKYDFKVVNKEGKLDETVEKVAKIIKKIIDKEGK